MIVCIDCFKMFQTMSNKNKTCNGPGSQLESENRTWHHAQTSRKNKVFYRLFERIMMTWSANFDDTISFTSLTTQFISEQHMSSRCISLRVQALTVIGLLELAHLPTLCLLFSCRGTRLSTFLISGIINEKTTTDYSAFGKKA